MSVEEIGKYVTDRRARIIEELDSYEEAMDRIRMWANQRCVRNTEEFQTLVELAMKKKLSSRAFAP